MIRQITALLKKDYLVESTYRLGVFFNIASVCASIISYYYIDRLFGAKMVPHLEEFGVNYFAYVLVSMAFFSYAGAGLGSFASRIEAERFEGTLESILLTPTKTSTLLCSVGLWNILVASLDAAVYILLGAYLFKIDFTGVNLLSTLIILVLTIASFSGLGILSAAFIMVFRRGNPVSWVISTLEGIVGGVYFPVSVLPGWLKSLAQFLPITHAIRGLELAVYRGYSPAQLAKEIGFLALLSIILLPMSVFLFKQSIRKARKDATLSER